MNEQNEERLLDLLCKQVSEGLTVEEQRELEKLEVSVETSVDLHSLEITAAAISMSAVGTGESLPDHLKSGILAGADEFFAKSQATKPMPAVRTTDEPSTSVWGWLGWAATAAASIALVASIFYYQQQMSTMQAQIDEMRKPAPPEPTMAQKRDQMIREARDLTRASWTKGNVKDMDSVSGEVVWSDEKQTGYMTFRGLPPNDPNREAYQLWIFEQADLEAHPKDGGVFNVAENGEVIVPIEAKLKTVSPKAFAVTVEKPGGVVVSGREKIAALAPVKPSST
jgi:anti-sigma-K factor RskA